MHCYEQFINILRDVEGAVVLNLSRVSNLNNLTLFNVVIMYYLDFKLIIVINHLSL